MNFNLGDILNAAAKRMDISNEASRMVDESRKSPATRAHENNDRVLDELEKKGINTSNVRGRI